MNKIVSRYSARQLKVFLIVYVLLLAAGSAGLILHSLGRGKSSPLTVTHMRPPALQVQLRPVVNRDSTLFKRVHSIRLWLDSLKQNKVKLTTADCVLLYRPGFYDSVILIEKVVQSSLNQ